MKQSKLINKMYNVTSYKTKAVSCVVIVMEQSLDEHLREWSAGVAKTPRVHTRNEEYR